MELVLGWLTFAFLAAWIADAKGRSAGKTFLLSIVLSPLIGIIVALALERKREQPAGPDPATQMRCPECREWILRGARKCKHCGSAISEDASRYIDCPACGARTPVSSPLCAECGVRIFDETRRPSAQAVSMGHDIGKLIGSILPKPKSTRKGWDKL